LILWWTFCLLFQSSFCCLLSFGKPPLVLSKLPIQAKFRASVMDAFFCKSCLIIKIIVDSSLLETKRA
jgi:hypothetical protein